MIILFQIIGGIIFLSLGAEIIVRSSVNLSNIYKVSGYFIGFTIVALGTSLPELAATFAAINLDSVEIALGNIIGSNVANILLILGIISLLNPIVFSRKNQTLYVLIITIGVFFLFYYINDIDKFYHIYLALFLLGILFLFLYKQYNSEIQQSNKEEPKKIQFSQLNSYILLLIGLLFLYFGSKYFIEGSKDFAYYFGISETIIGVTLVAFGTSLPELATGVIAAIKKQTGIAVGTILGSHIYNIVGIFAIILIFNKEDFPEQISLLIWNYLFMLFVTIIFVIKIKYGIKFLKIESLKLGKGTGIFFIVLYAIYILYNYINLN